MRAASPEDLDRVVEPVLTARVSPARFRKLVPLPTEQIHPLSAPEPSEGVVAQLENGAYVVLEYGRKTRTLKVSLAGKPAAGIEALLKEVPLEQEEILWSRVEEPATA